METRQRGGIFRGRRNLTDAVDALARLVIHVFNLTRRRDAALASAGGIAVHPGRLRNREVTMHACPSTGVVGELGRAHPVSPAPSHEERWYALEQARSFLPDDPLTAYQRLTQLDCELQRELRLEPEENRELAELAATVSALVLHARDAADQWREECSLRERRFRARERAPFETKERQPERASAPVKPTRRRGVPSLWRKLSVAYVLTLVSISSCARPPQAPMQDASATHQMAPSSSPSAVIFPDGRTIADVAAKVTPSVVNVFSTRKLDVDRHMSPFFSDPFFRFFFDRQRAPAPMSRREQSLGSGVIVSNDGIIITNNHVVADADEIRVALKDGREFKAKLVGADRESDVAVLRLEDAKDLTPIPVADSSKMRIGDMVLAIGNPFGVGQTVTMGIVSAVGRANMGITDYEDFIQTDAAINPGNSGGALVNMDGALVGINTAIVSRSGGYQGIGFAIPSNMAMQVKDAILTHGRVVRGWLGVSIQDLTDDLAKELNVGPRAGVLVADVANASPASKAGLQRGDIITAIDGARMEDARHLRTSVALAGAGRKIKVEVLRDGKSRSFEVTLEEIPTEAGKVKGSSEESGVFAGVVVQELTPSLRKRYDIPTDVQGVLVSEVEPDSSAAELGLRPGDVIVQVNRKDIGSVQDFRKVARESQQRALVLIYRDGGALFLSLSR